MDQGRSERARTTTVLVVEDDALLRRLVGRYVELLGFAVVEAASGSDALTRFDRASAVVAALIDVALPGGMNGLDLAQALVRRAPSLPVVFISGRALPTQDAQEEPAPYRAFLEKPFTLDALARTLRQVCVDDIPTQILRPDSGALAGPSAVALR